MEPRCLYPELRLRYLLIPAAFILILLNAFFGHLLFSPTGKQEITQYSIYVHLQPGWDSYPANILFDVTTVWTNPDSAESGYLDVPSDDYQYNQILQQRGKSFVVLEHQFSDCQQSWKPILYRYALDYAANIIDRLKGDELAGNPYVFKYPVVKNSFYSDAQQQLKTKTSFVQFIPICTILNSTDYEFSIKTNDPDIGFDVFFVSSKDEVNDYLEGKDFDYYNQDGCTGINMKSFSGTCRGISSSSGILVSIPDELESSLTRFKIGLHELS